MGQIRKGLSRSRLGCSTCRIRHVKCDETKPACQQCTVTGRKCDGYVAPRRETPVVKWRDPTTVRGIATLSVRNDEKRQLELHCLNAFRHQIVAFISDDPSRRLERLILQAIHQEPCVRHAAVAFSAHQLQVSSRWPSSTVDIAFGPESYGKSVRALRKLLLRPDRPSIEVALVCSLLGICYELVQGTYDGVRVHLENSLRVCSSLAVDNDILRAFIRLDVQGSTFVEGWVPRLNSHFADGDSFINSLESAQRHLYSCLSQLWSFLRGTIKDSRYLDARDRPPYIMDQSRTLTAQLKRWERLFHAFLDGLDSQNTDARYYSKALLIHHKTAQVYLATALCPDELCYDDYDSDFNFIVSLSRPLLDDRVSRADKNAFSLGLGIIQPLFFTATRCRKRSVRNEAIDLLSEVPGTEGVWNGVAMAKIAVIVKEVEESGLDEDFLKQHRIPEAKRVHSTGTDIDPRQNSSVVCCSLLPEGRKGAWDNRFFQVSW